MEIKVEGIERRLKRRKRVQEKNKYLIAKSELGSPAMCDKIHT